jgi:small nuclear ribonucleoprotein (snRNP)-like protein
MDENDLHLLRRSSNKLVRIRCRDGESLTARVHSVSDLSKDVIYDIISTNREHRYARRGLKATYTLAFEDIESVEPISDSSESVGSAEENQ